MPMDYHLIVSRPHVAERWQSSLAAFAVSTHTGVQTLPPAKTGSPVQVWVHLENEDEALRQACFKLAAQPGYWVLVLADEPADAEGIRLLRAGVRGYANTFVPLELLEQIRLTVASGEAWVGRSIMQKLIKRLAEPESLQEQAQDLARAFNLSNREQEVLYQLVEGSANKEIARALDITERTVKAHISAILKKTSQRDRVSLILQVKNRKIEATYNGY